MKDLIANINKVWKAGKICIMSILMVNEAFDFNSLKLTLNVSDGNLASHLKVLEEKGMIMVNNNYRQKPNTSYFNSSGILIFSNTQSLKILLNAIILLRINLHYKVLLIT
jgi:hypothetical protein